MLLTSITKEQYACYVTTLLDTTIITYNSLYVDCQTLCVSVNLMKCVIQEH